MVVTVLMIVSDNQELFSVHETTAAAWGALVSYVNVRWVSRFPLRPVPIQADERVEEFFGHNNEFYALGEADMSEIALGLDGA